MKTTFAILMGNRGFFPGELIAQSRSDLLDAIGRNGYNIIQPEETLTRYGAVETLAEGTLFAQFLAENRDKCDGVILSLPNFGDENGILAALQDWDKPILVQAFEDELDKMGPAHRRDSFCGKLSAMDVLSQAGIRFSTYAPHVLNPDRPLFDRHLQQFAAVCRVVGGLRRCRIGSVGARTTAFKTVRFDEVACQRAGIGVETFDLADVFYRMERIAQDRIEAHIPILREYGPCHTLSEKKEQALARLSLVLRELVDTYHLDAMALRCWGEFQQTYGISPCMLVSMFNHEGTPIACETDVCNAVAMHALSLASGRPAACFDWNNNYGQEMEKCVLFHCGPVPNDMLRGKGHLIGHVLLEKQYGSGNCDGVYAGEMDQFDFTYASMMTRDGGLAWYAGEGSFTGDELPKDSFGVCAVAQIPRLQEVLLHIGTEGFRHHLTMTRGLYADAVAEALTRYLGQQARRF